MVSKTRKAKAAPVEDEDIDDLEDLEDLDDFEDEDLEDEDDEEEDDEEEEETPRKRNDARNARAKASTKPSAVKTTKPAAKSKNGATAKAKGNASNLTPRRVTEGMMGASDLATAVNSDARTVRVILRKLKTEKSDNGLYEWKAGKSFDNLVKSVKKEIAAKA